MQWGVVNANDLGEYSFSAGVTGLGALRIDTEALSYGRRTRVDLFRLRTA